MPRANRFFISGHIYHLTHRCHDGNFLLKFDKDKKNWLDWLFEGKSRFHLSILNYVVTFNHIHLLVQDTGKEVISNSIKLIASASAKVLITGKREVCLLGGPLPRYSYPK